MRAKRIAICTQDEGESERKKSLVNERERKKREKRKREECAPK